MHGGSNRTAEYILNILFWIEYAIQLYRAVTSLATRQCCLLAVVSWSSTRPSVANVECLQSHCSTALLPVDLSRTWWPPRQLARVAQGPRSRFWSSLNTLSLDCFELPLLPVTTSPPPSLSLPHHLPGAAQSPWPPSKPSSWSTGVCTPLVPSFPSPMEPH